MAYKASHASRRGPTTPAGAGTEETFRSARFLCWIQDGRWRSARIATFTKANKTRGLALLLRPRGPDGWDKTVKTWRRGPTLTFLVIALAAEGRARQDYAPRLLSQQWNTGFP